MIYRHRNEIEALPPAPAAPVTLVMARSSAAKATDGLGAWQAFPPTPIEQVAFVLRNPLPSFAFFWSVKTVSTVGEVSMNTE